MNRSDYTEEVQKKHEALLLDVGNKLANPPPSTDELLTLLSRAEILLHYVFQTPHQSIKSAISPAMNALISVKIFKHIDLNVQVAVAACANEIIRIATPDYPYTDDQMKEIFGLFMAAFKQLSCESGKNYERALEILETVAEIRSCVIMLDIEIDSMIVEMFKIFLDTIRTNHSADVFKHMKTIMTMLIQESDEISEDLLRSLVSSVKLDNKSTSLRAWELGKSVIENCAARLQHHIRKAVKTMNLNVADYAEIVASLCQDTPIGNHTMENEEVESVWLATAEVTTAQFKAIDASGDGVSNLEERSQAVPDMQLQVERSRRGLKPNTFTRADEGYQHTWLAGGRGSSSAYYYLLSPSELKNAEMPSDSSQKEIDSVKKISIGKRVQSKKHESLTHQDKARGVNHRASDSDGEYQNEITSQKHESGDVDKVVESPMAKPAKAMQSLLREKHSNTRKNTTKRVVGSITLGAKKVQVNHSASDSELEDKNESTSQQHESADAEMVVESPISKPTKDNKFMVEENGTNVVGKKPTKGVLVQSKAKVSHSVADHIRKDKNEITSLKHESGDVDTVVESPMTKPAKAKQSEVKEKGSKKRKKMTRSVIAFVAEKGKVGHSVADSVAQDENELTPLKLESADVEKMVESSTSKPAKSEKSKLKEKGSCKQTKIIKSDIRSDALGVEKEKVSPGDADSKRNDEKRISARNHENYESAVIVDKVVESPKPAKANYPRDSDSEKEMEPMGVRLEYGQELVNTRIMVWWPLDETYYTGTIESFDPVTKKHKIIYDDDEEEILDMSEESWKLFNEIQSRQSSRKHEADPSPAKEPGRILRKTTKRKAGSSENEQTGSSSKRSKFEGVKSGNSETESIPMKDESDDEMHEANFSLKAKAMGRAGREGPKTSRRKGKPSRGAKLG